MRPVIWAIAASALSLSAGCARAPQGPIGTTEQAVLEAPPETTPVDALRRRAERLWQARLDQDWSAMFAFQDPQAVEGVSEEEYVAWAEENEPFLIEDYRLGDVITNGEMGWVEVYSRTGMRRFPAVPPRDVHRWEKWRIRDDRWFPVPPKELQYYPASPAERDTAEEPRLLARFEESWEARRQRDWDRLLELTDPAVRGEIPPEEFAESQELIEYLDCDVRWVEVLGDHGSVLVAIRHKLNDPSMSKLPPRTVVVTERWVKVDGEWYRDLTIPVENG
jgi:hypothetical protein